MSQGWVKLHRRIQDHWLWGYDKVFSRAQAWIDLLLMANHEPRKIGLQNEIVTVGTGEHITSERKLAERWGWSRKKVRNFLKLLSKDGMIEYSSEHGKRTRVKITNYEDYQNGNRDTAHHDSENAESGNQSGTSEEPPKHHSGTTGEPLGNTNKNEKNEKNEKKKPYDEEVDEVWEFYRETFEDLYKPRVLNETRKSKIRARLREFSVDEIKLAIKAIRRSGWHTGDNPKQKFYATPEFVFRNDENLEEWLNEAQRRKREREKLTPLERKLMQFEPELLERKEVHDLDDPIREVR